MEVCLTSTVGGAFAMTGYTDWLAAGQPYVDAQPVRDLSATLKRHGYTVYTRGDNSHMNASPPEDHTPFSLTGWPVPSARWYGHALDIMPPAAGSGLPSLDMLGSQLVLDRNSGVSGATAIKYMNWTPAGRLQPRQDSWEPGHAVRDSSDAGHIHISFRSDTTHSSIASGYDPVARLRGSGTIAVTGNTPAAAPPWPGRYVKLANPMMHGDDARTWQAQMTHRGWVISADGWWGPQSDHILRAFQAEKNLSVDGVLGPQSWTAAWTLPVT